MDLKVSVSVEKALSKALIDFADAYAKEHDVCIKSVSFDWTRTYNINDTYSFCNKVSVDTEYIRTSNKDCFVPQAKPVSRG